MSRWLSIIFALAILVTGAPALAGKSDLRKHVYALTSSDLRGRASGTSGGDDARDYVQKAFSAVGLHAAGPSGWEVATEVVVEAKTKASLRVGKHVLAQDVEFVAPGFSDSGKWRGKPVFVGHGLSVPNLGWDDYAGVDVRGKVVVAFTGAPPAIRSHLDENHAWQLTPESRAAVALAKGAVGLILINDARTYGDADYQRADELPEPRPDLALEGMMVIRMTRKVAARNFGPELMKREERLLGGASNSGVMNLELDLELSVDRDFEDAASVIGVVPDTSGPPLVIVAHFDGLGDQPDGSFDLIYEGADDNASGVAVMIEVARRLVASPPAGRTVLFVAADAEERGLRGSRSSARYLLGRYGKGTVVNMDMVGRMRDETLYVEAGEASLEIAMAAASDIELEEQAYGTSYSDHMAFMEVGNETLHLTTGRHADYHRVTDTIDELDFDGMLQVVGYTERLVRKLSAGSPLATDKSRP